MPLFLRNHYIYFWGLGGIKKETIRGFHSQRFSDFQTSTMREIMANIVLKICSLTTTTPAW